MNNQLTTAQAQPIVAEINEWHKHSDKWQIRSIEHLHSLSVESYHVRYTDGFSLVFVRDEGRNKLVPAASYTYHAPDFTGFDGISESEAQV